MRLGPDVCRRWPSSTQRCLKSNGILRRKMAEGIKGPGSSPDSCRQGPTWACAGHVSYSHMVLTQGEGLPQGGEWAAHKALGGRATWERSWRGSAKQRHREAEGANPGTRFQGSGSIEKGCCTLDTGKTLFRGPQRPKGQSDYLSCPGMQKEAPGT